MAVSARSKLLPWVVFMLLSLFVTAKLNKAKEALIIAGQKSRLSRLFCHQSVKRAFTSKAHTFWKVPWEYFFFIAMVQGCQSLLNSQSAKI